MRLSLYLHDEILAVLKCFGDLDTVIDKILLGISSSDIDIMDKPPAPDRAGAKRVDVNITNEEYIQLLRQFGPRSKKISLRRFLYWFVENEIYELINLEPLNDYSAIDEKLKSRINRISKQLEDLRDRAPSSYYDKFNIILKLLEEL